ncbi:MAG: hypothetical protein R6U63_12050 [Longimicrobiales bacterium]
MRLPPPTPARTDLAQITEAVLDVEAELRLLEQRVANVAFWERIRFKVHRQLLVRRGVMMPATAQPPALRRWLALVRKLKPALFRSALRGVPNCTAFFLGRGRRVMIPGQGWRSPYFGPLLPGCPTDSVVAEFFGTQPFSPAADGVPSLSMDAVNLRAFLRRARGSSVRLPANVRSLLTEVAQRLTDRTGTVVDVPRLVEADLNRRSRTIDLYDRVITDSGARVLVLVAAYLDHTAVEVARRRAIPVVELQHGVVSSHHLGYHYPETGGRPSTFPNWFLSWGDYWATAADWPLPDDRIVPTGFARFDRDCEAASEIRRVPGKILFISQTMLGERLSRFAAELARLGFRDRITFRLHPREEAGWRRRYPWLLEAGVQVSGAREPLYPALRKADVLVGTFSTALFEGLGLGARVFLVQAPGIEYMDALIRDGRATLVRIPGELAARLEGEPPPPSQEVWGADFFVPNARDQTCSAIDAIARGAAPGTMP